MTALGQALTAVVGFGLDRLVDCHGRSSLLPAFLHSWRWLRGCRLPILLIAGFGTVLFVGMAFVDFYTMPRTYRDDQYLAGALGMYLTYINLFIFILRLIIALQGGGRRD